LRRHLCEGRPGTRLSAEIEIVVDNQRKDLLEGGPLRLWDSLQTGRIEL